MEEISLSNKKKLIKIMLIAFFLLIVLICRIGYIQFFDGNRLQQESYEQLVIGRKCNSLCNYN